MEKKDVILHYPLIPDFTDSDENIEQINLFYLTESIDLIDLSKELQDEIIQRIEHENY
jgi:pyruvate-formate lyase-activating enzyme